MPGNKIRTDTGEIDAAKLSTSTFLSGTNLTWSGAFGSAAIFLDSIFNSPTGGFSNIYSIVNSQGAIATDGHGVIGIKSVVVNTAALTDGEIYAGQFIAKHNHATNAMGNSASLIGIEAWAYIAGVGIAGTCIGANFGWHNEATGGTYPAGTVIRGIQIFCDNNAGGNDPIESTGLAIWNQAGLVTNAIKMIESGTGFSYFLSIQGAKGAMGSLTGTPSVQAGWLLVDIDGTDRWIRLFSTGP